MNPVDASLPRRVPQPAIKDTATVNTAPSRGAGFGGFGRGEGGAFGGSKYSSGSVGEGRQPGAIGGGFGGVAKRSTRREEDANRPSAASTWRPVRNQSGTFEGVLGFGNSAASSPVDPPVNGRQDGDRGWGAAEKQWRAAPTDERPLTIPSLEPATQSVIATASATPVTERDAQLRESTPGPGSGAQTPIAQEPQVPAQDLGAINWYYRDPNGQEQGPFTGNQMHEWYSHSYFQDDLPVRRESETGFHKLSELKVNTGNAVQPFLSAVRPRLPPNLPIPIAALQGSAASPSVPSPGALNDSFGRLNMGSLPAPQPQYHPNAYQASHFGQQPQINNQYSTPFGGQQWNPAPGPQSPARLNGVYGSIGPQSSYSPYGSAIGTPPIQRPDMFGAPVGQPSPWAAPAPVNPAAAWQQQQQPIQQQMAPAPIAPQPQQQYQQTPQQAPQQPSANETSYFPPTEEIPAPAAAEPTAAENEYDDAHDESMIDDELAFESETEAVADLAAETAPAQEETVEDEEQDIVEDVEEEEVEEPAPKAAAPASAWAKTPKAPSTPSRKSTDEPTPAQASKLPPPHASLPPKPTTAPVKTESAKEASPPPAPATPVEKPAPKPAPWANSDKHAHGPSLREIQEAEARHAAVRKQARAEARAAASPASLVSSSQDDLPASMSWGLPSSKGAVAPPPSSSTPPTPAWGGGSEGPKKTLKQIQEEEERRKEKLARQQAAAVAAATPVSKRGYADLAATHSPSPAQSAAATAAGWTTVGAGGKAGSAPKPAPIPAKPAVTVVKPAVTPKAAPKAPVADEQPSIEFIRWTKQALTGLTAPVDDFISMLLSFPVDPPASSRAEVQEIIADSVYASSSTLDGRRFAQEFMTRRKADAKRDTSKPVPKIGSLADVVKTQPKAPAADVGFKVVKAKKKRS